MNSAADIPAQKRALRAAVLARRRAMTGRPAASRAICGKIARLPEFQNAAVLAAFAPMREETDITPLLQSALNSGKILLLPRVADFAAGKLAFHQVRNLAELRPVRAGKAQIPEPDPAKHPARDPVSAGFFLIPAVAADPQNFRLGYGGGFYDRLLAKLPPAAPTCCPIFAAQMEKKIPREAHDRPIWRIITEAN